LAETGHTCKCNTGKRYCETIKLISLYWIIPL